MYIYCLWVLGESRGHGYGKALMDYCISDARAKGKSGVCMLGSKKQKTWLSDMAFAEKYGFKVCDETQSGYRLLALSFDGTYPRFAPNAKTETIENRELTIYYDSQCPYISLFTGGVKQHCAEKNVPVNFVFIDSLEKAKNMPCVFNNFAVFYKGKFETVNLTDTAYIERILKK